MKPHLASCLNIIPAASAALLALSLSGCGSGTASIPVMTPPPPTAFTGRVLTGNTGIAGSSVQFYAAGTTGPGSAATPLLPSAVTTDSTGTFSIPATYTCPASTTQVYLVARGAKSTPTGPTTLALTFLSPIGQCGQVTSASAFVLNELTTAASAWALSQFLSADANLGVSASNSLGLANAQATVAALVDLGKGTVIGSAFPKNVTPPTARLHSLANLLNTCAAAPTGTQSTPCGLLFAASTLPSTAAPTDTLQAALNIVRRPAANAAALFTLSTASTVFTPALTAAPPDWTLFLTISGGGMSGPSGIGVDSTGSLWVANYFNVASRFTPLGAPVFPDGVTGFGLAASYGIAVDAKDNAWIPNEPNSPVQGNTVTVLNTAGQSVSGPTGFGGVGLSYPVAVAIDPNTNVWVVDYGDSKVSLLTADGKALPGPANYTFAFPIAIALDASHNAWIANQSGNTISHVTPDGSSIVNIACCDGASGIAIDQRGNAWVANYYGNSISEVAPDNHVLSAGYAREAVNHPQGIAIDGTGNVWATNYRSSSIVELAGASAPSAPGTLLSPPAGFGPDASLLEAYAIAVDASGNLWISNFGSSTLTKFIGLAAPVKTPLLGPPQQP